MAIAAKYRFEDWKATVIIRDDCMETPEKRQEIYERVFGYVENACIQAAMREAREKEVQGGG